MESENFTIIEQLELLRITSRSEIPPHEFLFTWSEVPCYARGELVAVTGKAKSGKTYLNSILMAAAGEELSRHTMPGNEHTKPESNSGITDKGHFLGLKRIREKPLRVLWIDTEQSEDSTHEILRDRIGAMVGAEAIDEVYHVFNLRQVRWQDRMTLVLSAIAICMPDLVIFDGIRDVVGDINNYVGADGKIDKAKLFGYVLQGDKSMSLAQLRQVVMNVANVRSFNFAFRLIEEACLQGILQPMEIEGKSGYRLSNNATF